MTRTYRIERSVREQVPAEAATTATESLLAGIWADAFELTNVGRQDDFLNLGGDSLIAAAIGARIYDALNVEVSLGTITDHPVLADLAAAIDQLVKAGVAQDAAALVRVPRHGPLSLSIAQERIWKYSATPKSSAGYTMAQHYRIEGALDAEVLRDCLTYMNRRHEILRTTFAVMGDRPAPVIHPPAPVHLPIVDLSGEADAEEQARQLFKRETERAFDLAKLPLLRFVLIKLGPEEHWLFRVSHSIISDAMSWNSYFREVSLLYEAWLYGRAPPLPEYASVQYVDFAAWQRYAMRPDMPQFRQAVEWWKATLARPPPRLELPFKRARPLTGLAPAEGTIAWGLDPESSRRLDELRREEGATYYMSRLAVLTALIAAETGEPDVILGTYANNRTRVALQNMIGFFSNPITLRLSCDIKTTFREWLIAVRDVVVETAAHSDIPYEEVFRRLQGYRMPVPDLLAFFAVLQAPVAERFAGLELHGMDHPAGTMPWGFTLECDEHNELDGCRVSFDAGIYDPQGVREFVERLRGFFSSVWRHPDLPLCELFPMSGIPWRSPAPERLLR